MAPGPLAQVLRQIPKVEDKNLLTADIPFADAGVYRISPNCALVQSIDFFTPIVNDPNIYGRIAAANALSDIYAMGGRPITALNLIGFPKCLGQEILVAVLTGGAEKVHEAGAVIVGGHTVDDDEPKYGLSVTGLVDPARLITTAGARPGDRLLLTKPLGTGILATALKGGVLTEADMREAIDGMMTLNRVASETMQTIGVHACTDITGFGLLGHALELARASRVGIVLQGEQLPVYPQVFEMAAIGLIPEGGYNNRSHYLSGVFNRDDLKATVLDILTDPQTSGGLLISVAADKEEALTQALGTGGCRAWSIGRVTADHPEKIRIE
ncbi:MAG: selenide, water dikinase SelD [Desulfuromonadales bacterium]|nr:selenide, water dikinase SelD [Desulfuromonadales bacterium]